jgi:hypothetical protein
MRVALALVLFGSLGCGSTESTSDPTDTGGAAGEETLESSTPSDSVAEVAADGAPPAARCAPLPITGTVIDVSDSAKLVQAVYDAKEGDTILVADGTYDLGGKTIQLRTRGVTLRGKSGDRSKVILDSGYAMGAGDSILMTASDTTVAHLTVKRAYNHPLHVTPAGADIRNTRIHDVYVLDPGEQGIKVNSDGAGHYTNEGTITCSKIELTDAGRPSVRNNCYTGGIDIHRARGWRVSDNEIAGFWCPVGLSEHGVHIWTGSRDSIVERNVIRECARGIGLGLGEGTDGRTYDDMPCGGATKVGHYGGIVRNNFIFASNPAVSFDTGIGLEEACGAKVVHNTVFSTMAPLSSSIEWRFAKTNVEITNNLTSHSLKDRGAGAMATSAGNASATAAMFRDAANGDLHLTSNVSGAVEVPAGICDDDVDGEARSSPRDVGADEVK